MMQVVTRNHNFEFVVWDSVSPANIEELRNAVSHSPEKCGDGMKVLPPVMDSL